MVKKSTKYCISLYSIINILENKISYIKFLKIVSHNLLKLLRAKNV